MEVPAALPSFPAGGTTDAGGGVYIMAKDYAKAFYTSKVWEKTRRGFVKYKGGLCERCLAKGIYNPGVIVHHKIHITPENIGDPSVTLNFDNLELVCRECHADVHSSKEGKRFIIDENGRVIIPPGDPPIYSE